MGPENCPPIAKMSTQVQRQRGDAKKGMGLQTGRKQRIAITRFRSISNVVIFISFTGRVPTFGVLLTTETCHAKNVADGTAKHFGYKNIF